MQRLIKTASIALLTLLLILVPMLFKPDAAQAGFTLRCREVQYNHGQSTFANVTDYTLLTANCRGEGRHAPFQPTGLPLHKFIGYRDGRLVWEFNPDRTNQSKGFVNSCDNSWIRVQQADWNGQSHITKLYANCFNLDHDRYEESNIILDERISLRTGMDGKSKLEWHN